MIAEAVAAIPAAGWALLFLAVGIAGWVLVKRDVRLKGFEVAGRRELAAERRRNSQHDIVTLISSQHANATNLLQSLRNAICRAGAECLDLKTAAQAMTLEDVAARVEYRIEREVLQDLIRNHFGDKTDEELKAYSDAKADGYRERICAELRGFAARFPGQDIGAVIDGITEEECRALFFKIYSSANRIAGEHRKNS